MRNILKSKKGNVFSTIMIALLIFLVGMLVANFFKPEIDTARIGLNCDDTANITDGTKLMCLSVDITLVYFIILVLSIVGGIITDKLLI